MELWKILGVLLFTFATASKCSWDSANRVNLKKTMVLFCSAVVLEYLFYKMWEWGWLLIMLEKFAYGVEFVGVYVSKVMTWEIPL